MGNPTSKIGQEVQVEETPEGSLPSTPILTPRTRIVDLDPRSPSANILRTPIEVICTPKRKSISDTQEATNIVTPSDVVTDPRSPTTDFTRTPIVVSDNANSLPFKLYNKNLDNVRKTLTPFSPISAKSKTDDGCNLRKIIAPKLLESSPITLKPLNIKRKSFCGLLETNLDYVETDLDTVINRERQSDSKRPGNNDDNLTKDSEVQELNAIEKINLDECVQNEFEEDGLMQNENVDKCIEVLSDDCVIAELPSAANVKDFDRKLTNLIYEDQEINITNAIKSITVLEDNRTPLGERNLNTDNNPKKVISKLKVSDKPRRLEKEMSKIPVLKDKLNKGKLSLPQCENTPPPSNIKMFYDGKTKTQQWDPNNTLII